MIEIELGNDAYRGKCPHIGTQPVVEAGDPLVIFWLCQQCFDLREQDKRLAATL